MHFSYVCHTVVRYAPSYHLVGWNSLLRLFKTTSQRWLVPFLMRVGIQASVLVNFMCQRDWTMKPSYLVKHPECFYERVSFFVVVFLLKLTFKWVDFKEIALHGVGKPPPIWRGLTRTNPIKARILAAVLLACTSSWSLWSVVLLHQIGGHQASTVIWVNFLK